MFLCYLTLFTQAHLLQAISRPEGKYIHHTHVHEDLLLWYILFVRETHEHEGIFPTSISLALLHITKTHVTHCLLCHIYAFSNSYDLSSHDCINVGGDNACCMSFQSFTCYFLHILSKALMYVVINYQKGGD